MISNNNLFKIKKEIDIYEVINDNKEKSIFILFVEKIKNEEEIIKLSNKYNNIIILIVLIDEFIPEGNININKIPDIIIYNDYNINNKKIQEEIKKIIF